MSFIKTSNMDKYCYRKGDIVKLSNECLKSIGRKRIFSQNLFYIKDMDGLFANVSSDDVDVKIPIRDILPVKINSIEDRDIYYDPVVAASVIGAGQETPTSKKDKGEYYLNVNPAKRNAMVVKNEKRFLKQKRNALKNPGYSHHPVKTQASFKRLLKAV